MPTPQTPLPLPLTTLFRRLRSAGFRVDAGREFQLRRVLDEQGRAYVGRFGELKYLLAPYVVTSGKEQAEFYDFWDAYVTEVAARAEAETDPAPAAAPTLDELPETPQRKWLRRALAGLLLVTLGLLVWWIIGQEPAAEVKEVVVAIADQETSRSVVPTSEGEAGIYRIRQPNKRWHEGQELRLLNASLGELDGEDSTGFVWRLLAGDTLLAEREGYDVSFPDTLRRGQELRVELNGGHLGERVANSVATYPLRVLCADPPYYDSISYPPDPLDSYVPITFAVHPAQADVSYSWDFGDGQGIMTGPQVQKTFVEGGYVEAQVTAVRGGDTLYCRETFDFNLAIFEGLPILPYLPLEKDAATIVTRTALWPQLLLGLITFLALFNTFRQLREQYARRTKAREDAIAAATPPEPPDVGPYTIPYRSLAGQISVPPDVYRIADALRSREAAARTVFDGPATVAATVTTGGFPTWRERNLRRPASYLLLLRFADEAQQQDRLFRRLADFLLDREANLTVYHHLGDYQHFWNDEHPDGWTPTQLAARYGDHRLVLLGDGHGLVDPHGTSAPRLRSRGRRWLLRWERRLILTPEPVADWSYPERLLLQEAPLYPATTAGIRAGVADLNANEEYFPPAYDRWYETLAPLHPEPAYRHHRWDTVADHEAYLAHDPDLLRWLRALAVCSQPDWDLTIAIGKALGLEITHNRLLQLSRIPWLADNAPDTELRLALLATLPAVDERLAREAVLAELEAVKPLVAGSFAAAEHEAAEVVHLFGLDPTDTSLFPRLVALRDARLFSGDQLQELDLTAAKAAGSHLEDTGEDRAPNLTAWLAPNPPHRIFNWGNLWLLALLCMGLFLLYVLRVVGENYPYNESETAWWQTSEVLDDEALRMNNRAAELWAWVDKASGDTPLDALRDSMLEAGRQVQQAILARNGDYPLAQRNQVRLIYDTYGLLHNRYQRGTAEFSALDFDAKEPLLERFVDTLKRDFGDTFPEINDILHLRGLYLYDRYEQERDSLDRNGNIIATIKDTAYFQRAQTVLNQLEERTGGAYIDSLERYEGIMANLRTLLRQESRKRDENEPAAEELTPANPPVNDASLNKLFALRAEDFYDELYFLFRPDLRELPGLVNQLNDLLTRKKQQTAIFSIDKELKEMGAERFTIFNNSLNGTFLYLGDRPTNDERITSFRNQPRQAFILAFEAEGVVQLSQSLNQLSTTLQDMGFTVTYRYNPTPKEILALEQAQANLAKGEVLSIIAGLNGLGDDGPMFPTASGDNLARKIALDSFTNNYSDNINHQVIYVIKAIPEAEEGTTPETKPDTVTTETLENFDLASYRNRPVRFPEMVTVAGGEFMMGSDDADAYDREKPVHRVRLSTFQMAKYEVTAADYLRFAAENQEHLPEWLEAGNKNHIRTGDDDSYQRLGPALLGRHPIVGVSWDNAIAYANWLSRQRGLQAVYSDTGGAMRFDTKANGYRLPTEAEWEYAARSGGRDDQKWAGTNAENELARYANYVGDDPFEFMAPVGSLLPNPAGLHDMSGNVLEWVWDGYDDYNEIPADTMVNPLGPERAAYRVYRGGSWIYVALNCRCAFRDWYVPGGRDSDLGFRLAAPVQVSSGQR